MLDLFFSRSRPKKFEKRYFCTIYFCTIYFVSCQCARSKKITSFFILFVKKNRQKITSLFLQNWKFTIFRALEILGADWFTFIFLTIEIKKIYFCEIYDLSFLGLVDGRQILSRVGSAGPWEKFLPDDKKKRTSHPKLAAAKNNRK